MRSEEEKKEQRRKAQKKYYEKNKDYYRKQSLNEVKRVRKERNLYKEIIKEAREYIKSHREAVDERAGHIIYFLKDDFDEEDILKILNKGE